jgi:hypothetical protein
LHELRGDTVLGEGRDAIAFGEETTVIAEAGGGDNYDARERGLFNFEVQACHEVHFLVCPLKIPRWVPVKALLYL